MCTLASLTYLSVTGPVVLPVISLLIGLKEKKGRTDTEIGSQPADNDRHGLQ